MARPRTISDEQILDAARLVFFRDGASASTAAVAREAGVSEGTVFKRFATKHELMCRALELPTPTFLDELGDLVEVGDVRDRLVWVCESLIDFFTKHLPRALHLMTTGAFDPKRFWDDQPECAPRHIVDRLTDYVAAEAAAGRLHADDPEVMARALAGTMHNYVFFQLMNFDEGREREASAFARSFVDTLWTGLRPDDDE